MSDFNLRDATEQDIPALISLWRQLEEAQGKARIFPLRADAEEVVAADFRETIAADDGRIVVAEDDSGIIGMALLWYWESKRSLDPMPIVDFSKVVVDRHHRGRGIASAFIEEAESFGRARGARFLQAHLFSGNDDGKAFWENRGFVPRYEARARPILDDDGDL